MAVLMLMLSLVVTALLLVLMPAEPALMLDYLVMLALACSGSQLGLLYAWNIHIYLGIETQVNTILPTSKFVDIHLPSYLL